MLTLSLLEYTVLTTLLLLFIAPVVLAAAGSSVATTFLWVDDELLHGYAVLCLLLGVVVYVPVGITTVYRRLTVRPVPEDVESHSILVDMEVKKSSTKTFLKSLGRCYHALLIILYVFNKDVVSTRKSAVENARDVGFFALRGLQVDFFLLMAVEALARCSACFARCEMIGEGGCKGGSSTEAEVMT
ncbi:hypothetical protein FB45DRAFT_859964 [Roridomyces roridus]|uniref:Uncharacterized protein n=1 Tax=Roridomyces roridus TaxID=1738132 RepID=A0AAD7G3G6_9AGAR|nr:hypothetical protein FB45DRAFT_859964 [Roridomyces roridus]